MALRLSWPAVPRQPPCVEQPLLATADFLHLFAPLDLGIAFEVWLHEWPSSLRGE